MSTITISPTISHTITHPAISTARPTPSRTAAGASVRPGQVRLTRRGRLVVFGLALAAILLLGIVFGAGSVATGERGAPEPTRVVMVGAGDTLWSIAAEINTDGDVRSTMSDIKRLNALDSVVIDAGQKLRVPME